MSDDPRASGLKHDLWLSPEAAPIATVADAVFAETESRRQRGSRTPRADAIERRRQVISNIVTNLAACLLLRGPQGRLAIATEHGAVTRYDRPGFPLQVIAQCVCALESAGFVYRYPGSRGNAVTILEPSEELVARLQEGGITLADVGQVPGAEMIILKAPDPKRPDLKRLVEYADTPETRRMRAEMERINQFINGARVTFDGRNRLPIHLERQFLITSAGAPRTFDAHGRLYGGWWIDMPNVDRHRIRIDGEPCADLDFRAMLTCLAYARAGAPLPEGDPYAGFPELESPTDKQRQAIKQGLNALYFRSGPMQRLPDEVKAVLGSDWTARRFMAAASERHAPIAHFFGQSIGLSLLYTESQIMVRTLLTLINLGITGLPIHDGLLCRASEVAAAMDAMRDASLATVGIALPVMRKTLGAANSPHMVPRPR